MADVQSIKAANEAILDCFNRGDYDTCMTYYTTDAILIPPDGDVIRGRDDIKSNLMKEMPAMRDFRMGDFICIEMLNATTAYTLGYAHCVNKDGTKRMTLKNGLLWKKVDGKWLLDKDMFNDCGGPL